MIQALVTPGLPGRMAPPAARRTLDLDAAHRGLEPPAAGQPVQRELARDGDQTVRDGPPAAAFSSCRRTVACAMGAFAAVGAEVGAEERLPDSFHAARSSCSKFAHDLESRYGIEPVDLLLTIGFRSAFWPGVSVKGQIRGSTSARLGQVQGGSRRMRPPKFLPAGHRGGAHARPRFRPARSLFDTHTAAEQEEPAEAVRGGFSAGGCPLGDDDPPAPLTSGIDRAIRLSTAVAVLAVAGIAAYVSYGHAEPVSFCRRARLAADRTGQAGGAIFRRRVAETQAGVYITAHWGRIIPEPSQRRCTKRHAVASAWLSAGDNPVARGGVAAWKSAVVR